MTTPTIFIFLLATVLGCADDPELNENAIGDEELAAREDAAADIDAEIAAEIARHDAVLARNGYPALGARERCVIAARHRQQNATEVCATTSSQ